MLQTSDPGPPTRMFRTFDEKVSNLLIDSTLSETHALQKNGTNIVEGWVEKRAFSLSFCGKGSTCP